MTVYTVDFKKMGNWQTFTAVFKTLENAKKFSACDYTEKVVTHNFKTKERAYNFVTHCSYGNFVEDESAEDCYVIRKMIGLTK